MTTSSVTQTSTDLPMAANTTQPSLNASAEQHKDAHIYDVNADRADGSSSSSLSDPGDRSVDEEAAQGSNSQADNAVDDLVGASDTEAETERLEKTPRKRRNVLLTSGMATPQDHEETPENQERAVSQQPTRTIHDDSSDDATSQNNPSPSRKRKRPGLEQTKVSRKDNLHEEINYRSSSSSPSLDGSEGSLEDKSEEENGDASPNGNETRAHTPISGQRKQMAIQDTAEDQQDSLVERLYGDDIDGASSALEDVDVEDAGDGDAGDTENAAKMEEHMVKKKSAMDSLGAIENCFATLRDRLFDERLAQCQEELAMLEKPHFLHPELAMMKEVIDQRRNQKVQYEQTLLRYKLESLQRESIAERAQIQSQYMQTVSGLRDNSLAQINKAIYQTQRERRNCESDLPDYMYEYNPKRSQQVTHQMAYNEEVSLLSGIAKHVGFPAAPGVDIARAKEYESDRRLMDQHMEIAENAQNVLHNQRPILRASLSAATTFGRLQSGSEDHFLQQNAWANPQHPAHQMHRQFTVLTQAETPSATPADHRAAMDSSLHQGSASTILDIPSGPASSYVATPATGEATGDVPAGLHRNLLQREIEATPSRIVRLEDNDDNFVHHRKDQRPKNATPEASARIPNPFIHKDSAQERVTQNAAAKTASFAQGEADIGVPVPDRFPKFKAEEVSLITH